MNVIYILWIRQIKRFLRSKARLIGSVGQPLLFLLAFGFGFGPVFQRAGQGNYIEFLAPGIIAMSVLFTAIFSGMEIIWDRQFGFLKETLVAPVSRFKIMIGRTLGGATVAVLQGLIVLAISFFAGFRITNFSLFPVALVFMVFIALLFTAFGTALASRMQDAQGFQLIINFLVMPIFFLSGAMFPLTGLPRVLTVITNLNPLAYGVDGLRGSLIANSIFGLWTDFGILAGVTIIFIILGSYLFSKIEI
ncbi:MAG: ABC transporter permease [Patescibacteria group bacterium]